MTQHLKASEAMNRFDLQPFRYLAARQNWSSPWNRLEIGHYGAYSSSHIAFRRSRMYTGVPGGPRLFAPFLPGTLQRREKRRGMQNALREFATCLCCLSSIASYRWLIPDIADGWFLPQHSQSTCLSGKSMPSAYLRFL